MLKWIWKYCLKPFKGTKRDITYHTCEYNSGFRKSILISSWYQALKAALIRIESVIVNTQLRPADFLSLFLQNEFVNLLISSSLAPVNLIPFAPGIRLIMMGWKWLVPLLFANHLWQMREEDRRENFALAIKKKNDVCNQIISINSYCLKVNNHHLSSCPT